MLADTQVVHIVGSLRKEVKTARSLFPLSPIVGVGASGASAEWAGAKRQRHKLSHIHRQ